MSTEYSFGPGTNNDPTLPNDGIEREGDETKGRMSVKRPKGRPSFDNSILLEHCRRLGVSLYREACRLMEVDGLDKTVNFLRGKVADDVLDALVQTSLEEGWR